MRYLSVCSGIEAASVAWHHLGWQPVGFSEIEPFPSAVLAHRFPNVPNFGDMTRHAEWNLGPGSIDLLVGGTPCQSFSVAGLRKGLSDPRGGLMLTYLEIAQRLRPRWIVWENVPGVLSSGSGRDLGAFLGALGELGYGWAYRVLDAQWVRVDRWPKAVPQRRRRLFVVGCLGAPTAAAQVLLERQSVCRDIEKGAKTREGAAADAAASVGAGCYWDGSDCAGTLTKQNANGAQRMPDKDNFGAVLQPVGYRWQNDREGLVEDGTAPACRASTGSSGFHEMNHPVIAQPVPIQDGREMQKAQNGIGIGQQGDPAYTLDTTGAQAVAQPVAFRKSRRAQSVNDHETWVAAEQANTLNQFDTGERDTHAVLGTDCYNGAITGDVAATMGTPGSSVNASGPTVMTSAAVAHTVAFHPTQDPISSSDTFHAIGTGNKAGCATAAVAQAMQVQWASGGGQIENNTAQALRSNAEYNYQFARVAMTVRRLTPRECERLQGFPDDWTMIPWRKKAADECPDGPRYKALGNSMAVNVMAWIGERIAGVEARSAHNP